MDDTVLTKKQTTNNPWVQKILLKQNNNNHNRDIVISCVSSIRIYNNFGKTVV